MSQSAISDDEIRLRLSICSELFIDKEKPAKEAYDCWMTKNKTENVDFSKFEFWFKRFKNNKLDLGSNVKVKISNNKNAKTEDIANKTVNMNIDKLPFDPKFSHYFQDYINKNMASINSINMSIGDSCCWLGFGDSVKIRFEKAKGKWRVVYKMHPEKWILAKPEKFIVDHIRFVLRSKSIKLTMMKIDEHNSSSQLLDFGKLNVELQMMFDSLEHQIHTTRLYTQSVDAYTFFTILRGLKPGTLEEISFGTSHYQNMEEIVMLDQWKQVKTVWSPKVTSLTVDDVLHCESITLGLDTITPDDVVRLRDRFLESPNSKSCTLTSVNDHLDFAEINLALQLGALNPKITKSPHANDIKYCYQIPNSEQKLTLSLYDNKVSLIKSKK